MQRFILLALAVLFAFVFLHSRAFAQPQSPSTAFEQQTYVYEPWIKGKFSEVVTVKNPGRWIFLAGIGPESEGDGKIIFPAISTGSASMRITGSRSSWRCTAPR